MPAPTPEKPCAANGNGLVVAAFRGVRFDPLAVPDLAAVTSPPYDVVDPDGASRLEALHPYNVVRLILPRTARQGPVGHYEHAAATLATWLREGVLRRDAEPAIYVYDQQRGEVSQRGLLAAVGLRPPPDQVVLPHEDVMPRPVQDRLDLMRATGANLEPILLVYDGGETTRRVVDRATDGAPLVDAVTEDGARHRLWAVTDQLQHQLIAAELVPKQALIADGHHRYAGYLELQAERHAAGDGAGPWDFGLALLVDNRSYPLELHSISRVVADLALAEALHLARRVFATILECASLDDGLRLLAATGDTHPFLLTDGSAFILLSNPDPAELETAVGPSTAGGPHRLDAAVLHALLLERLWEVPDLGNRISYIHDVEDAVRAARRTGGIAILLRPVTLTEVMAVAARGDRMPRKSTSFGPKPRTGFVLRLLDD